MLFRVSENLVQGAKANNPALRLTTPRSIGK